MPVRAVLLALVLSILIITCAEVVPPPGGPEDKTAPVLLSSTPANGDTLVPLGNTITLQFSERIVRPRTGRPIYISPRPEDEPEVDWKSDEIVIHLADSFKTDQTYIVTVSPTVTDLRNNRLDTAITVAFTTGTSIASGVISGNVYSDPDKPQPGVVAALYELPESGETIDYDSIYPEYMTTTNNEGYFALRYLPTKSYRLIAFEDKNRDDRFNPYTEPFAVPDRPINLGGEERLDRLMMFTTSMDTSKAAVIGAAYTSDHLVRVRLSRKLNPSYLADHLSDMQLRPDSVPGPPISARGFEESQMEETGNILASFGTVPEGMYTIWIRYDSTKPPIEYPNFSVTAVEDETPPKVEDFQPGRIPLFAKQVHIQMTFSEPLDTSAINDQSLKLWWGDSLQIPISTAWLDPFHMKILPSDTLAAGNYSLQVTEFDFVDPAGNLLGDSLRTYSFSVLDADSLGSITGTVTIRLTNKIGDPVILWFQKTADKHIFQQKADTSGFSIEVPAGKYLLSGFIDSNGDDKLGRGSVIPFSFSETVGNYPDTVAVRARFETAGIKFEFQ